MVAAYWPGITTSIRTYDPILKRIGKVMYFLKHSVRLTDVNNRNKKTKTFILPSTVVSISYLSRIFW